MAWWSRTRPLQRLSQQAGGAGRRGGTGKAPPAGQGAGGKITAKVEERPTAANESQDQLRLSKAAAERPGRQGRDERRGSRASPRRRNWKTPRRVAELERNVTDLENLAIVKNKAGAEAEKNASVPAAAPAPQASPGRQAPGRQAGAEETAGHQTRRQAGRAGAEPDRLHHGQPAADRRRRGRAAARRPARRAAPQEDASRPCRSRSILNVPAEPAHSMFAETGGQSVDTNNSVFNSSFAPSASQLDTNEVDPVAEADVYIAYGRDAQAEEILKEALRMHPERYPVRLKLLEIYAARKDQRAFETQAGELYSMTRGQGDEWAQAAALGLSIDPANPLYAHSARRPRRRRARGLGQQACCRRNWTMCSAPPRRSHVATTPRACADGLRPAFRRRDGHRAAAPAPATNAPATGRRRSRTTTCSISTWAAWRSSRPPTRRREAAHGAGRRGDVPDLDFDMSAFDAPAVRRRRAEPPPRPWPWTSRRGRAARLLVRHGLRPGRESGAAAAAAGTGNAPVRRSASARRRTPRPTGSAAPTDIDMANLAREFDLPDLPTELQEHAGRARAGPPPTERPLFDLDAMDFGWPSAARRPAPARCRRRRRWTSICSTSRPRRPPAEAPFAEPASPSTSCRAEQVCTALRLAAASTSTCRPTALPLPEVQALSEPQFDDAAPCRPPCRPAELSPAHMEMETKLDLAIAYQEIGDKEGARELLDEVIRGGNASRRHGQLDARPAGVR